MDRVGTIVHSEAIHYDGVDINDNVPKDLYLETSGSWFHPLRGQKWFPFICIWHGKYLVPDDNLVLSQPLFSR